MLRVFEECLNSVGPPRVLIPTLTMVGVFVCFKNPKSYCCPESSTIFQEINRSVMKTISLLKKEILRNNRKIFNNIHYILVLLGEPTAATAFVK